jgi:branched-chain amino acid aminotransferase
MNQPVAYLNGKWIPASEAAISVTDAGFVLGSSVAEQLRTFSGKLFRLEDHLERLGHSLQAIGVDPGINRRQWTDFSQELLERNSKFLAPGDDWGVSIFVTPGIYRTYSPPLEQNRATVCLHVYPLPFYLWADKYRTGQALATTPIEQIPSQCWTPELKCRSRMHYYLADKMAMNQYPDARAILLDREGYITETSTANILIYRKDEGLIYPPPQKTLHGISLAVTLEIAKRLHIPYNHRNLTPEDLASANEAILTSTPPCLLPATKFNGTPIGDGRPGEIFHRLLAAWNEIAGLDIVIQAERFISRNLTIAQT